jgi:hypothetical protein
MSARLKIGDISIAELLKVSYQYYRKVDDKAWRAKVDIKSATMVHRNNYTYDKKEKNWVQTGREVRLDFFVRSKPESYKKIDTINTHVYPVTFLLREIDKGIYSAFRWRTGGYKKILFAKKGMTKQQRILIANANIKNGSQLNFFFHLEWVSKQYGLLFGPCRANGAPDTVNKNKEIFFDKTALTIVIKILIPLLGKDGGKLKKYYKNDENFNPQEVIKEFK